VGRVVTGATRLPTGVELYFFDADGVATRTDAAGVRPLGTDAGMLRFIDDGQFAHYFVGDARTSPERPSNATYKLGVVAPHSAFTPHAHGGEHFVLSLGHASCGVHDEHRDTAVDLRLTPGMMVRIPAMMPHSFGNRAGHPLLILAANTGYGIDHEDYAITAAEADRRGEVALTKALLALEEHAPDLATTWRERLATRLRRLAGRLDGTS
jgi:mannose-6-phosphate isomerase-like protein (cupin superfamily)